MSMMCCMLFMCCSRLVWSVLLLVYCFVEARRDWGERRGHGRVVCEDYAWLRSSSTSGRREPERERERHRERERARDRERETETEQRHRDRDRDREERERDRDRDRERDIEKATQKKTQREPFGESHSERKKKLGRATIHGDLADLGGVELDEHLVVDLANNDSNNSN